MDSKEEWYMSDVIVKIDKVNKLY
ncbi:hypothetical protein Q604_UNBc4C00260G0001, partial [human gut metagenome]